MDRILVLGGSGLVGSSIVRKLGDTYTIYAPNHSDVNLLNAEEVRQCFDYVRPKYVFHCAAKVGGIKANIQEPANFIYQNIVISSNVIHSAWEFDVKKLINLGSSCIYPVYSTSLNEGMLLKGSLEPTNEYYALAKIASIKLCEAYNKQYKTNFVSIMPPNLFGPNDNFDLETSHFIPAMIRKFSEGNTVILWGKGKVRREAMYVDDLATILINIMLSTRPELNNFTLLNVGTGIDYTIEEYANIIKEIINPNATILWDDSKPEGVQQKLLDLSLFNNLFFGFQFTPLKEAITKTYEWYKN